MQSAFTVFGLSLATGLMVLPGSMGDSIDYMLTYQWNDVQRQDAVVFLAEVHLVDGDTRRRCRQHSRHRIGAHA